MERYMNQTCLFVRVLISAEQHPESNASDEQSALEIAFIALKFKIQV